MDLDASYLVGDDDAVHVGFIGQFGTHVVSPRSLVAEYLTKTVCLEGIVTKCSLVRPKMVRSVHFCPATNKFTSREYRDATDWGESGPTASTYPTKDPEGELPCPVVLAALYMRRRAVGRGCYTAHV